MGRKGEKSNEFILDSQKFSLSDLRMKMSKKVIKVSFLVPQMFDITVICCE